jgi:tRNA-specific 2-thiouridylase
LESTVQRNAPIAVLLSGGVDSSTALMRLKELGYRNLHAYYLKIWLEDELSGLGACPWEEDLAYARAVCNQADVPLTVVPLQLEYYERVVSYAIEELRQGRTPSPDIFCNQRIKFGAFWDAVPNHIEAVATGHYARVQHDETRSRLLIAPDPVKDQTYFLSHLTQEQLSRVLFPIGDMEKSEVRAYAERLDLATQERPDSQGICFLGKIKYPDFVRHYLGEQEGAIVEEETGRRLGSHRGYWFHTIGQRQGLGLGNGPWYVVRKEPESNTVFVSHQENVGDRARQRFEITELHWTGAPPAIGEPLRTKIRHGPEWRDCVLRQTGDPNRLEVEMTDADRGVAPGQFAVLYRDEECLGAGRIAS